MADELERLEQALRRILWDLRVYLADVVLIGGWVPHLYRRYGGLAEWHSSISLTAEADILVRSELPPGDRPLIADLLARAGFHPVGAGPASAVWATDTADGERVEFLIPHTGTARQIGTVRSVFRQPRLGAVALTDLDLLQEFTSALHVPVTPRDGTTESLSVNVPRLGAYAIVKANTYMKRMALSKGANPKRAKDLLYLRDLIAAGEEVKVRIRDDMRVMIRGKRQAHSYVAAARNRLEPMTRTTPEELDAAAQMLAERDGVSRDAALADIKGHIADMVDLIGDVLVDTS